MLKICLDTCAFFSMIKYHEEYVSGGENALVETIKQDKRDIENFRQNLLGLMSPEFLEKHSDLSFDEQLDRYKDYATLIIKSAIKKFVVFKKNAKGIFFDKDGNEITREITEQQREIFNQKAQEIKSLYKKISKTYNDYLKAREDYKLLLQDYQMGLIFKDHLDGKYDFYITPTTFAEIQNHADDNDSISTKGNIKIEQSKIDSLLNEHCTLLTISDRELSDRVYEIAKQFRTNQGKTTKEMAPDINSLGLFGDSMIMAEASLAGIMLITFNTKDFISDKSSKPGNDRIRRHIALVEKENEPYTSDALPFSPIELLEGKIIEPTTQSLYDLQQPFYQDIQDYYTFTAN